MLSGGGESDERDTDTHTHTNSLSQQPTLYRVKLCAPFSQSRTLQFVVLLSTRTSLGHIYPALVLSRKTLDIFPRLCKSTGFHVDRVPLFCICF